jgi:hypothetical protein
MIFILISWIYITLVCLIWGNRLVKLFLFRRVPATDSTDHIDFPVICLIGMSVTAIIVFYLSLVIPLFPVIKLALQLPALLTLMYKRNRREIYFQVKNYFKHFDRTDFILMSVAVAMVLVISTGQVIHPDTLNYHAFSAQIFDKFGVIPGIANLKQEFGFQSMWFAALAFFHFSFSDSVLIFPLNGCAMAWLIIFLVSGLADKNNTQGRRTGFNDRIWYLILILFVIFSWTQIRLTSASLSPDFLATLSVLLGFYFFTGIRNTGTRENADFLASFFSVVAVAVKLSATPVLLIPFIVVVYWLIQRKYSNAISLILLLGFLMAPIVVRNIISTGYPLYPSTFAAFYNADWRVANSDVLDFQKYITAYARYPVTRSISAQVYHYSLADWLPLWWNHLYMSDRLLMILVLTGVLLNIWFLRKIRKVYSRRRVASLIVSVIGVCFWFIHAPDPRFGTGFIIPFIYFLYYPLILRPPKNMPGYIHKANHAIVKTASVCILIYIGYREAYFFHTAQLILPEGIQQISNTRDDCDAVIKKMVLYNAFPLPAVPDSCLYFRFRGATVRQGFLPEQKLFH